ncbi:MAG: hypothetical protein JWL84_581 [Rhodospirillales bacterium]|nr:hypothetical protein [Rhodospirillales bacterium]
MPPNDIDQRLRRDTRLIIVCGCLGVLFAVGLGVFLGLHLTASLTADEARDATMVISLSTIGLGVVAFLLFK